MPDLARRPAFDSRALQGSTQRSKSPDSRADDGPTHRRSRTVQTARRAPVSADDALEAHASVGRLLFSKSDRSKIWIVVSVTQFVDDTIAAIDLFIEDLQVRGPKSQLLARFRRGYAGTCTLLHEYKIGKKGQLCLNAYSKDGIDWIRQNAK
jgi:hypothetical protein